MAARRGGWQKAVAIIVLLAFGFAFGVFITRVGPIAVLVGLPVFLVLVVVSVGRSLRGLFAAPSGPVPCPRCEREPRTASGWCTPCTTSLAGAAEPDRADVFAAATAGADSAALAAHLAPQVAVGYPTGLERRMSSRAWLRGTRRNRWIYGSRRSDLRLLRNDPVDADLIWAFSHDRARGRFGIADLDVELVVRFRLEHDLIAEITLFPPVRSG